MSLDQIFAPTSPGRLIEARRNAIGLQMEISDGKVGHDNIADVFLGTLKSSPQSGNELIEITRRNVSLLIAVSPARNGTAALYVIRWADHATGDNWTLLTGDHQFFRGSLFVATHQFRAKTGCDIASLAENLVVAIAA